jgi:AraC-like DNA-binding protein
MKPHLLLLLAILMITPSGIFSQTADSVLEVPYSRQEIKVDGDLSDWKTYAEYTFTDTLHSFTSKDHTGELNQIFPKNFDFNNLLLPKSRNKVVFRIFWDNTNLNCAFMVWDRHFFAEKPSRIDKPMVHLNDGIELYIDTKNEHSPKMDVNDYQFLVDIKNEREVFKGDIREILADTVAVPKDYAQNVLFYSAVKLYGTLNDDVADSLFIVELSIPFAAIGLSPKSGMHLHADICVNDIDYPVSKTLFVEEVSTAMWPFNWSGYSDFGYPADWKEVQLTGGPGWCEKVSEKYKSEWFVIYLFTVTLSFFLIVFLMLRVRKLHRMPLAHEIDKKRYSVQNFHNEMSYNEKILQKAARIITARHADPIHSEELAKNLGLSLRTFQRITREELHVTPTNYIYIVKLNLAADFLKAKAGNVTEAAYRFGFSDPSYFSRQFKKHFGVSPTEYIQKANH